MRIVSLNAWGGAMFDALAAWLPVCDADIVCLQEMTRTDGLQGWTTYTDGDRTLPQRADLVADVEALLPGHQAHYLVSDVGPVWDDDGRRWPQEFGIATFVRRRFPVIGVGSRFVHGSFAVHEDWRDGGIRPRVAQALRVTDPEVGRTITLVHVHGLRDPGGKGDTPERHAQARRLVELVSEASGAEDDVVLCGDLNLLPDSVTFDRLAEVGLTDLVGDADTRTSRCRKPERHASYLLVSDPAKVRHFEVVATPEVSDHRPLLLEI